MVESEHPEQRRRRRVVVPSRTDPLLAHMTELVGGPVGRRAAPGLVRPAFFSIERVLVLMVLAAGILAVLAKFHCRQAGWTTPDQYSTVCWSEFPNTFRDRGLGAFFPYVSQASTFDYPPLAGLLAGLTAWLSAPAGAGAARQLAYFDINAWLAVVLWMVAVLATARSSRRRPWDASLVAASPLLLFTATVSWDMWAVALTAVGMFLFARARTFAAGALLGLAACVQPYVFLILIALLLVSLRSGRWTPLVETTSAFVVAALAVVLPILVLNPVTLLAYVQAWPQDRAGASSLYNVFNLVSTRISGRALSLGTVNILALSLFACIAGGICWLALAAGRRPRVAQLSYLLVAGYTVVDKHAAPQHAVWLLPLLVLSLPQTRTVLLWQAAQLAGFVALQLFLSRELGGISTNHAIDMPYFAFAVLVQHLATLVTMVLVVRAIMHPERDPVRRAGADDPQAGPLDEAPDRLTVKPLYRRSPRVALESASTSQPQGDKPR
jgi:uncharacterized membrane protein